jgi:hypothetical protein
MTVPVIAAVAFLCVQTTQVDRLDDGLAELRSDITAVIAQVETQRPYSCRLLDDKQRSAPSGAATRAPSSGSSAGACATAGHPEWAGT